MKNLFLLDCTLRDGGYLNDWEFGHDNIVNIFERIVRAGIDFVEVGFLDERRIFDINRSIFPTSDCAEKIYGKLDCKKSFVVGMIDFGTCDISKLQPCSESLLDGIRVIFKKDKMHEAMEYCAKVKALGYKVFSQLVSVTAYTDDELREVIGLANEVKPYALSMVDTYGLLNPEALKHIMKVIDDNLDKDIVLGFHGHNNLQLGYINATTVLDYDTDRSILVDGTLYGMGKSAGNAPIELVAMYMNEHHGKNYVITELQEAITTSIIDLQKRFPWGYQLFHYIAASNKVHPNYVAHLMNKRTLSITAINEILQRMPEDQKLEKNMKLIEQLYMEYQKNECDDSEDILRLTKELEGRKILVIGPGLSVGRYGQQIDKYIDDNKPIIIAVNHIPADYHPEYLFITNTTRHLQSSFMLHDDKNANIKIIASSNLTKNARVFDYVVNYSGIIDEKAEFPDNSMCMLIRVLIRCCCKEVALAGMDGYTPDNVNYLDVTKAYSFLKEKAESLNEYARDFFEEVSDRINIMFVTPSEYQKR